MVKARLRLYPKPDLDNANGGMQTDKFFLVHFRLVLTEMDFLFLLIPAASPKQGMPYLLLPDKYYQRAISIAYLIPKNNSTCK